MELDAERLLRILPHRSPFLLLDRVTELSPRKSARGVKCVTASEPFFQGHFPGHPIFPSVLIIESMSQLLAVLAYASEPFDTSQKVLYFLGFDAAKFRRPVVPGDRMILEVEITQRRSNIWKAHATATVEGNLCAQAELLAALTDRGELPHP
jgi:3-hydroxyacyl-[acyl-carrier-protein] dehydratase